ncbi:thioredoxin family protein [Nocardia sp. JMUB6875]|uniref:thioredoxin family protein n=1 Tax=Nocardia sp. JMUB6875 TaxID=3158170 RepID=UPI0034E84818
MEPIVVAADLERLLADESRAVLIDFTASWCAPCQDLAPKLEQYAAAESERLRVVAVDLDSHPDLVSRYAVQGVPTLILLWRGDIILEWCGRTNLDDLTTVLDALHSTAPTVESPRPVPPRPARTVRIAGPLPGVVQILSDDTTVPDDAAAAGELVIATAAGQEIGLTIGDADITGLSRLAPDTFDALTLMGITLRDGDLDHIVHLTGLTRLAIYGSDLSPTGIARLGELTALRALDIEGDPDSGPHPDPVAIDGLRTALPHARINGTWVSPAFRALVPSSAGIETDSPAAEPVTAVLHARRYAPRRVAAYLTLRIAPDYYVHVPGSDTGSPLTIAVPAQSPWRIRETPVFPSTEDGRLTGTVLVAIDLDGRSPILTLDLRVQACQDDRCLAPVQLSVSCAAPAA